MIAERKSSYVTDYPLPLLPTLPMYGSRIRAGFPSPADDYIEARLNLQEVLATYPLPPFT
jgi:hypothetical protein